MKEKQYKDRAKVITLGQAVKCMRYGIYIAVSNGKDLIVTTEEGEENADMSNLQ